MKDALKNLRRFHGRKQNELATLLDISPAHLCGIEKGTKQPSLEILQRYSEIFGIRLSSLIYFIEQSETESKSESRPISSKVMKMLAWVESATR